MYVCIHLNGSVNGSVYSMCICFHVEIYGEIHGYRDTGKDPKHSGFSLLRGLAGAPQYLR